MTLSELNTIPVMADGKRAKLVIGLDFGTTFSGYFATRYSLVYM
jgi:hypothetical protein